MLITVVIEFRDGRLTTTSPSYPRLKRAIQFTEALPEGQIGTGLSYDDRIKGSRSSFFSARHSSSVPATEC